MGPEYESERSRYAQLLLDHVPSLLAYWDRELRCRFANRAYERWFGVDPQRLVGVAMPDLLGTDLFVRNERHVVGALRGEEQVFEREVLCADGTRRHGLVCYLPDLVDGQVLGFMVEVSDVTRPKQTEAALREQAEALQRANELLRSSESALRQAQRLGRIGSWEWDIDADVIAWSDQLYRILGWPPDRPPPNYAEHLALYEPQSWERLHQAVERTRATGEPYIVELQYVHPDGVRGWIEARGEAVRDEQGRVVRLRGTALDVTERHHAEEARRQRDQARQAEQAAQQELQQREMQWRELFLQASDGIFVADLEGRYTDVNDAACRLLGREREELLGMAIADLLPPADLPRLAQEKAELLEGSTHVQEWSLRHKDGSLIPVEVSARILSDGRWIALVRDISERRRVLQASQAMAAELERRVLQRTRQLHRLAADLEAAENRERREIAHDLHDDLGQTLAAARIRLASLAAELPESARAGLDALGELIDTATRSTRSLAAQLAPAMLYELGLSPALEWLGEDIERNFGIEVAVIDDDEPKPLSQEARSILYRATRELLINAAKHARSRTARVEIARVDGRIVIHVTDAGVGFDTTRLDNGRSGGLGLISVRERLSFIGGTLEVRSIPGDGTVAVLSAPLASDELVDEEAA